MPSFQIGTRVETSDNVIEVTVTPNAVIPPGVHHFQLVVVDDAGNESAPAVAEVVVRDSTRPTAVLSIEPTQVQPGQSFRLNGSKSSDVAPGKLVRFVWVMLD